MASEDSPIQVHGLSVTPLTQCAHWFSPLDIIAIKHACCNKFFACVSCHDSLSSHGRQVWPLQQRNELAVLCGNCRRLMSIEEYMESGSRCGGEEGCGRGFNPGCKNHWDLYFALEQGEHACLKK